MKKLIIFLLITSILAFAGCSNKEENKELKENINIQIINIYKTDENSNYQEKIYGAPIITLDDLKDINNIKNAINNAKITEGIFDIAVSDYIIEIIENETTKEYYLLWIKEENETSSMMNQKSPNIILSITAKDTTILKEIIFK
jgi:hypothetical protein